MIALICVHLIGARNGAFSEISIERMALRVLLFAHVLAMACLTPAAGLSLVVCVKPATRSCRAATRRCLPARAQVEDFTEVQKLRAEAESPFSQVRLFAFPVLFAAASIATYFGATALLASSMGVRDPSPTGVTDLLIDIGSMAVTGWLWRRETQVRDSALKRIAFGSKLAALRIFLLMAGGDSVRPQAVALANLRRGRGQARRVVLLCAPEEGLKASLRVACASAEALLENDFLIVPLIIAPGSSAAAPRLAVPSLEQLQSLANSSSLLQKGSRAARAAEAPRVPLTTDTQPALPWDEALPDASGAWPIALPQSEAGAWTSALAPELVQAVKQDAAIMGRGLTIVLKKNGRVGTRRLGTPDWASLIADVRGRKEAGMDVVNI